MSDTVLAALIGGIFSGGVLGLIQFLIARHDKKKREASVEIKALRYMMLYITQERGKELLQAGEATLEEKRALHKWYELYHDGLGGNGDLENLMHEVDKLKIKLS